MTPIIPMTCGAYSSNLIGFAEEFALLTRSFEAIVTRLCGRQNFKILSENRTLGYECVASSEIFRLDCIRGYGTFRPQCAKMVDRLKRFLFSVLTKTIFKSRRSLNTRARIST